VANQRFLDTMARLPAGVVLVTARAGEEFRGLTASSLVSVSAEPPLVLVSLERESATRAAVLETKAFNISVLTKSQEFIADRFAGRAPAIPLLDGCAAWLECDLMQTHLAGDHDVCVGEVKQAEMGSGDPLILWDRSFWTLH